MTTVVDDAAAARARRLVWPACRTLVHGPHEALVSCEARDGRLFASHSSHPRSRPQPCVLPGPQLRLGAASRPVQRAPAPRLSSDTLMGIGQRRREAGNVPCREVQDVWEDDVGRLRPTRRPGDAAGPRVPALPWARQAGWKPAVGVASPVLSIVRRRLGLARRIDLLAAPGQTNKSRSSSGRSWVSRSIASARSARTVHTRSLPTSLTGSVSVR